MSTNVNEAAAGYVAAVDAALAPLGLGAVEPDLFPVGWQVEATRDGQRAVRRAFNALPLATEGLAAVERAVRAEQREDHVLRAGSLLVEDGRLVTPAGRMHVERQALGHLFGADILGVAMGGVASALREAGRASTAEAMWRAAHATAPDLDKRRKLRTRRAPDGGRALFAVVSERYTAYDADRMARELRNAIGDDGRLAEARMEGGYDGYGLDARVVWHNDAPEPCTGDTFQVGLRLKGADDRSRSISGELIARRNRCQNYIIIGENAVALGRQRHIGAKDRVDAAVRGMVTKALDAVGKVFEAWGAAAREVILDAAEPGKAAEVFGRLVEHKAVWVAGVKPEDLKARLIAAWQVEPGVGKNAIINAITRAAHGGAPWKGASAWTAASTLEAQAGQLLYVRIAA